MSDGESVILYKTNVLIISHTLLETCLSFLSRLLIEYRNGFPPHSFYKLPRISDERVCVFANSSVGGSHEGEWSGRLVRAHGSYTCQFVSDCILIIGYSCV